MSSPSPPGSSEQQLDPYNSRNDASSPTTNAITRPASPTSAASSSANFAPPASLPVPSSVLHLYLGAGAVLLTVGVALGIRLGNRQAIQLERDNPPPPEQQQQRKGRLPPPITPQQRQAAFRATIGALGLGTVLCAGFGGALVYGMSRYWNVNDTKGFAARMDGVVSDQRRRWLGSMVSAATSHRSSAHTVARSLLLVFSAHARWRWSGIERVE